MLELLILYTLNKNELTMYGLKKSIATHFGEISKPSHGSLIPALRRLKEKKLVNVRNKLSDGGKRYTYYSVTDNFVSYFNDKFMKINSSSTETTDTFLLETKARLFTYELLDKHLLPEFKERILLKLNIYENLINEKLNNSYLELNEIQSKISALYKEEIQMYKSLLEALN